MHPATYSAAKRASGGEASHSAAAGQPIMAPIPRAIDATGMSRSAIYREAGRGNIRLVKLGRTTLVDMQSVRDFLAGLPTASIKPPKAGA